MLENVYVVIYLIVITTAVIVGLVDRFRLKEDIRVAKRKLVEYRTDDDLLIINLKDQISTLKTKLKAKSREIRVVTKIVDEFDDSNKD
jgi:hypothetical protein